MGFGIPEEVLKSNEVNWHFLILGNINPELMPLLDANHLIGHKLIPLLVLPVLLIHTSVMGQRAQKQEIRDYHIKGIPHAAQNSISLIFLVIGDSVRKMGLVDPSPVVHDALPLKSRILQACVQTKLHHHVGSSGNSCYTF